MLQGSSLPTKAPRTMFACMYVTYLLQNGWTDLAKINVSSALVTDMFMAKKFPDPGFGISGQKWISHYIQYRDEKFINIATVLLRLKVRCPFQSPIAAKPPEDSDEAVIFLHISYLTYM